MYLTLGCYGRTENGFILCSSVNNNILKLDDTLVDIDGIFNYLEAVKLFDRPLLDQNAIRHLIYNLQNRFDQKIKRLWNDHEYNLLERFLNMHKPCGVYSQLILSPYEFKNKDENEIVSFIKASSNNKLRNRNYK